MTSRSTCGYFIGFSLQDSFPNDSQSPDIAMSQEGIKMNRSENEILQLIILIILKHFSFVPEILGTKIEPTVNKLLVTRKKFSFCINIFKYSEFILLFVF